MKAEEELLLSASKIYPMKLAEPVKNAVKAVRDIHEQMGKWSKIDFDMADQEYKDFFNTQRDFFNTLLEAAASVSRNKKL
jgi:hypothetical protein